MKKCKKYKVAQKGLNNLPKPFTQSNTYAGSAQEDSAIQMFNSEMGKSPSYNYNTNDLVEFDPTDISKLLNGLVTGTRAVANEVNNVKASKKELSQYLKIIQPVGYENNERYGFNGNPVFTKYGGATKYQTGGINEDYYGSSAVLSYYKNILNDKLKAKNPEAFSNYFKGLVELRRQGKSKEAFEYVQNTPYNDFLTPDEVKSTLGEDGYNRYIESLKKVNTYNVEQGSQPLYGTEEKDNDITKLNYGRRFASMTVKPTYNISNDTGTKKYARSYNFNPKTNEIEINEEGDFSMKPSFFQDKASLNRQFGGRSRDLVEAEKGEVFEDTSNNIVKISDSAPSHEEGGVIVPDVARVLENTSDLRSDKASRYLKLDPAQIKSLTGFDTTKSMSHAKALDKANENNEKLRNKIVKKIDLASKGIQSVDKYSENAIKLNMDHFKAIPTKTQLFDRLFAHQETLKAVEGIGQSDQAKYGGKYQVGGYKGNKSGLKTPAGNSDAFPETDQFTFKNYLDNLTSQGFKHEGITSNADLQKALYEYKIQNKQFDDIREMWKEGMHQSGMKEAQKLGFVDSKGVFKPGILDSEENLKKLGSLYPDNLLGRRLLNIKNSKSITPRIWTDDENVEVSEKKQDVQKQQNLDTSIKNNLDISSQPTSKFNEPLRWFDVASPLGTFLSSDRVAEKYNPAQFNQLKYKLLDPTAALQQNQADFNSAVQSVQNTPGVGAGVQMANIANLAAQKYSFNNQVLGNYENQNAQIKNNEILYNSQVRDKQSVADQQAREVFEDKVLSSKAIQQEQKLTALDSLYKTIAQNKALNRNGNLIMKLSRAFDQYGEYNGYQTKFSVNPTLGFNDPQQSVGKTKFEPAGGIQGLEAGKSYYNRRTGKTLYFNGSTLVER